MRYGISVKSDITIRTKRFECKEGTICLDMNVYKELKNYNLQSTVWRLCILKIIIGTSNVFV